MKLRKKKVDEYDEHGLHLSLRWDLFIVGSSVFVPTITPRKAGRWFKKQGAKKGMEVEFKAGQENGIYGVRLFRKS